MAKPSGPSSGQSSGQSSVEQAVQEALTYIQGLDASCIYIDGYQCQAEGPSINESSLAYAHIVDDSGSLPGLVLHAWPLAYERFLADDYLQEEQKKLMHYRVSFSITGDLVTVLFRPLLLPAVSNGVVTGKLRATFGQEVRIDVDIKRGELGKVIYGR